MGSGEAGFVKLDGVRSCRRNSWSTGGAEQLLHSDGFEDVGREMGAEGSEESVPVLRSDDDVVVRVDVRRDARGFDLKVG